MSQENADLSQMRKDMDAFAHIIEMLAKCMQYSDVPVDPVAVQRIARVLRKHITCSLSER